MILSAAIFADKIAEVKNQSGDEDIIVRSGKKLTFTPANWSKYQEVTLEAGEDTDTTNGQAVIRISAPGIANKDITAKEIDKDSADAAGIAAVADARALPGDRNKWKIPIAQAMVKRAILACS